MCRQDSPARDRNEATPVYTGFTVQRIVEHAVSTGNACIHDPLLASTGHRQVIPGVKDDGQAIEHFTGGAYALGASKSSLEGGNAGQRTREQVDQAPAPGVEQLPGRVQIQADLRLCQGLFVGEVRLSALRRFIADPIEARRTVSVVDQAAREGPALLA